MDPFNGDFIQRQAIAAAIFNDIHVIHVTYDFPGEITTQKEDLVTTDNLTEQIIYFKKGKSVSSKLTDQLRWLSFYKRAIRKYIITAGKPDLVHVHIPIKAGILGLWIKRVYKIPYLITEHWGIYNDIIEDNFESRRYVFKKYTKRIFQNSSGLMSVSSYLIYGVQNILGKMISYVIPNVVNTDFFYLKEKENSDFRFTHVSNMVALKNPEGILNAFKKVIHQNNKAELIMIGDTDLSIRNYANSLKLPDGCLTFLGEITYEQVAVEMQKANCLILFSDIENSPCVIGEALCCGIPVIATNVGGIPELIDGDNGILIKPKDENALADSMQNILNGVYSFDQKKIAENAQSKFNYSVIGIKIDSVYTKTLKERTVN